ncbi:MAG: FAD/NAD(P)-binding protein [Polyangiaceae bacterium]|nr:FAD/NAD(P)-binding protein [Polyangiaceae bacterium]
MSARLDWLIVGGGVHGTHLSHVLVNRAGVAPARVRVLDPQELPLATFWRVTAATGMRYLRSPGVHHVDLHPYALRRFAKRGAGKRVARFVYPYERPGLAFFRAHTEHVVQEHGLGALRERGRATAITRLEGGYRVETDQGALDARRVVLALGLAEQLCVPAWAQALRGDGRVDHIFSATFHREAITDAASVAIVGGGISAAQLACALAAAGTEATIIARHAPRVHRFDSDPGWLGPKAMVGFACTRDPRERRRQIASARHRGSMPPEIASELRREARGGRVKWLEAEPLAAHATATGVQIRLDRAPYVVDAARVVLATGFETRRPGGALLGEEAIDRLGLPCAECGYPLVSSRLEWAEGLFVSGPLAELELGPSARNIAGARAAGERLLAAA